jgi:outer membrane protein
MKLKKIFGLLALASLSFTAIAQGKFGHINSQELLSAMPETDSAQKKLEKLAKDNESALEEMTVEFNKKYEDYVQKMNDTENSMSELIRAAKEAELQEMQQRIQTFQQQAERDMQQQRMVLFQPIQEKAVAAVNDVAKENGFTYIFDTGTGVIVYSAPDAQDILPLVKAKLGLK